jgi:hypothetical protein
MGSHALAPPLYPFVFAASVRRQVNPPDCKMLESGMRSHAFAPPLYPFVFAAFMQTSGDST